FTDHSARLTEALRLANDRAWQALEFALAGDSLLDLVARADDRAFRDQLRAFLASARLEYPPNVGMDFRARCLEELREARRSGLLSGALDAPGLAREAGWFAGFAGSSDLLDAETRAVQQIADAFPPSRYSHLAHLLRLRPARGSPVLVAA